MRHTENVVVNLLKDFLGLTFGFKGNDPEFTMKKT